MDEILNRVCSIANHPVALLEDRFRIDYVKGLGSCLYLLSQNSPVTYLFFGAWATSILNSPADAKTFWRNDIDALRKVVSLKRRGLSFFSMKKFFFFDVFYLLESSFIKGYRQEEAFTYLNDNICGFFTKGALRKSHLAYKDKTDLSIFNNALVSHMQQNQEHLKQTEKRILVVANVSAGKSTLINAITGYRLNKTRTTSCTGKIVYLHNKRAADGLTIQNADGNYEYFDDIEHVNSESFLHAAFPFHSQLDSTNICFIDTPGWNNCNEAQHRIITEDDNKKESYDAILYISNRQFNGTIDEYQLLSLLKDEARKPIFFVLNQLDRFNKKQDSVGKMIKDYRNDLIKIGFSSPIIIPTSAEAALLFKLPDSRLDDEDVKDRDTLYSRFCQDYYQLTSYIGQPSSINPIENTGINYLEKLIKNI